MSMERADYSKTGLMTWVHKNSLSDEQLLTQLPVLGMFYRGGETPVGSRNGHLNDAQAAVFIMVVIMLWAITGAPPQTVCTVRMGWSLEGHNMG